MKDNAEKLKDLKDRLIARGIYGIPTSVHDLLPLCGIDTDLAGSLQNGIDPQSVFDSYCRKEREKLLSEQDAAEKQVVKRKEQVLNVLSKIFSALRRTEDALQRDHTEIFRCTFISEADKHRIAEEFLNLNRFLDSVGCALRETDMLRSPLCTEAQETWTLKAAALLWNLTLSDAYSAWDDAQRTCNIRMKEILQLLDGYRNFAFLVKKLTADLQEKILSALEFSTGSLPILRSTTEEQHVFNCIRAFRIQLRQLAKEYSLPIEN